MRKAVMWRLLALEAKQGEKVPTFEEFRTKWGQMDELSRSIYTEICGNPQNYRDEPRKQRRYLERLRKYLKQMGLIGQDVRSLLDIARELEGGDCNASPND